MLRNIVIILTVIITLYTGNVYIADKYNHRIRYMSAATGNITTIAGNGNYYGYSSGDGGPATAALLNEHFDIAVDSSGRSTFLLGLVGEIIILKIIILT